MLMATDFGSKFFGNRVMPFLEKVGKFFKGVAYTIGTICISPYIAYQLVKEDSGEESSCKKPLDSIIKKPQDPIIEELIKTQIELDKMKEQIKTIEKNHDTLCGDVEHLYELI